MKHKAMIKAIQYFVTLAHAEETRLNAEIARLFMESMASNRAINALLDERKRTQKVLDGLVRFQNQLGAHTVKPYSAWSTKQCHRALTVELSNLYVETYDQEVGAAYVFVKNNSLARSSDTRLSAEATEIQRKRAKDQETLDIAQAFALAHPDEPADQTDIEGVMSTLEPSPA